MIVYDKLWNLIYDRHITRSKLCEECGISRVTMVRMKKTNLYHWTLSTEYARNLIVIFLISYHIRAIIYINIQMKELFHILFSK